MPTSKKILFHSPQLQTYLKESRAHGSIPPFTAAAMDATGKKKTEMQEYLMAWEQNWKGLGLTGYALIFLPCFILESHRIAATFIFWCSSNPTAGKIKVSHARSGILSCSSLRIFESWTGAPDKRNLWSRSTFG